MKLPAFFQLLICFARCTYSLAQFLFSNLLAPCLISKTQALEKMSLTPKQNKTRTPQVGAISKTQKAQNIFFGKKLEIFEKKIRKMSHSAEKCKRGGPFLIYKHAFCSKITKNSKGGPFGDIKKIRKKSHSAEKKSKGGGGYETLVPSGLVCNVEKVNECAPRLPLAVQ